MTGSDESVILTKVRSVLILNQVQNDVIVAVILTNSPANRQVKIKIKQKNFNFELALLTFNFLIFYHLPIPPHHFPRRSWGMEKLAGKISSRPDEC